MCDGDLLSGRVVPAILISIDFLFLVSNISLPSCKSSESEDDVLLSLSSTPLLVSSFLSSFSSLTADLSSLIFFSSHCALSSSSTFGEDSIHSISLLTDVVCVSFVDSTGSSRSSDSSFVALDIDSEGDLWLSYDFDSCRCGLGVKGDGEGVLLEVQSSDCTHCSMIASSSFSRAACRSLSFTCTSGVSSLFFSLLLFFLCLLLLWW